MNVPLPTTGISGGISETGVATIDVPMFVDTLAEALSVLPNLGIGIPYRSRAFTQEDDGGFKVTLHFEGMTDDAKDEDQVTFELDTSMAEDPIQTHPFFDTLKTRYAWDAAKEQFAETLPESSGEQTALSGTVWIVSPPGATSDDEPDVTWTPYAQHLVFWNLQHAARLIPPKAPNPPLRLRTGLAGGVGDRINDALLSFVNDRNAEAEAFFGQADARGIFWST